MTIEELTTSPGFFPVTENLLKMWEANQYPANHEPLGFFLYRNSALPPNYGDISKLSISHVYKVPLDRLFLVPFSTAVKQATLTYNDVTLRDFGSPSIIPIPNVTAERYIRDNGIYDESVEVSEIPVSAIMTSEECELGFIFDSRQSPPRTPIYDYILLYLYSGDGNYVISNVRGYFPSQSSFLNFIETVPDFTSDMAEYLKDSGYTLSPIPRYFANIAVTGYSNKCYGVYGRSGLLSNGIATSKFNLDLYTLFPNFIGTVSDAVHLVNVTERLEYRDFGTMDGAYTPGYGGGTASTPSGGGGTFDTSPGPSQTIPVGSPAPSITQTGLFHVYIPTLAELQNLGAWLWYQDWNVQSFSRLFSDPVSNILALARAPIDLGTLFSNDTATIHFANLSTGVSANYLSNSNARHDWGAVDIKQFWGGAMDFSPYTKMQLYLPWGTGFVDLKISDFMGGSIRIYTNFDAVSGDCLHILVDGHGRALYSYPGNIYQNIPFSGSKSLSSALSGIVGAGTSFAMGYVTGGAGGGLAAAALSSARSVANADFNAQRGGNSGAAGALMGVQYPYIIMDRPIQSIPASFGADRGYPSNVTAKLSNLKGYTEVREIHLDGIPATEVELSEIETLLKGGVFL